MRHIENVDKIEISQPRVTVSSTEVEQLLLELIN